MASDSLDRHDGSMKMTGDTHFGSGEARLFRHVILPLRLSLGFVWLATGLICIAGTAEGHELIGRLGIDGAAATWIIRLTSAFEIFLALLILSGCRPRPVAAIQILLIAGFTVIVSIFRDFSLIPTDPRRLVRLVKAISGL